MTVIRTAERALQSLGYGVDMVYLSRSVAPGQKQVQLAPRPTPAGVVWNVASKALLGRLSLNECLFYSGKGRVALRKLVAQRQYSFVLCDMLRVVELVRGLGVPVVIDFDDLLSERYKRALQGGHSGVEILGYVRQELPFGGTMVDFLVRGLVAIERSLLRRRELTVARTCAACSLVSRKEAVMLADRSGRKVHVLPMAVDLPQAADTSPPAPGSGAVFLGKMDYAPNADAMRYFVHDVLPQMRPLMPGFILDIIGQCPEALRQELGQPGVKFVGYVPDLNAALRSYACMVAPIVSGSGVKTKVLDAMAVRLPVVGTTMAFEGLGVESGREGLVANSGPEMASAIHRMLTDSGLRWRVASAAQELVRREFEFSVIRARWAELVADLAEGLPGN